MKSPADELLDLERALLNPAVRRDRPRVENLLARDFEEFGSSGRVWTRQQIVDALAMEANQEIRAGEFRCTLLAATVALITYRTMRTDLTTGIHTTALRSSLWTKESGGWRLRFHQGTIAP